jgi:hypothetical protein
MVNSKIILEIIPNEMNEPLGNKSRNQAATGFVYIFAASRELHDGENKDILNKQKRLIPLQE